MDPNELPADTAVRETKEETGYDIRIVSPHQVLEFEYPNACSLPLPFQTSLEKIPASSKQEAHEHIDLLTCSDCRDNFEAAITHYRGHFLADFYLDDSNEFGLPAGRYVKRGLSTYLH